MSYMERPLEPDIPSEQECRAPPSVGEIMAAALEYAKRGWFVFPVPPRTKKSYKSAEHSDGRPWGATIDPLEIKRDWRRWPEANVGVRTGPISDFFVVEADTVEGHDVDGIGALQALIEAHGPLPSTVEAVSPSGSRHLYFRWPRDGGVSNSASKVGPGIDVRGDGGMVVAPPSVKPGAGGYYWANSPRNAELADCPEWLLELIRKSQETPEHPGSARPQPANAQPVSRPPVGSHVDQRARACADRALEGNAAELAETPRGRRNDKLNRVAYRLGRFVGAGLLDEARVIAELEQACVSCGVWQEDGVHKCRATIDSGVRAGAATPWSIEDLTGRDPAEDFDATQIRVGGERPPGQRADRDGSSGDTSEDKTGSSSGGGRSAGGASHQRCRVRLLTWAELKAERNAPREYLIDRQLRTGVLASVNARPGGGKTALLVELAFALSSEAPFNGAATKRCSVVYIAIEDEDDVRARLEARGADDVRLVVAEEPFLLTKPTVAASLVLEAIGRAKERAPNLPVVVMIDTLRAALGGASVIEDKNTSPGLTKLREVSERTGAAIFIANHTNRSDAMQTKGETLESLVALEYLLLENHGSIQLWLGKNRSGPSRRQIATISMKGVNVDGVGCALIDEFKPFDPHVGEGRSNRGRPSGSAKHFLDSVREALGDHGEQRRVRGEASAPRVRMVDLEHVKSVFAVRYPVAEGSEDKRADAVRKALERAVKTVTDREWACTENRDGRSWWWLSSPTDGFDIDDSEVG